MVVTGCATISHDHEQVAESSPLSKMSLVTQSMHIAGVSKERRSTCVVDLLEAEFMSNTKRPYTDDKYGVGGV